MDLQLRYAHLTYPKIITSYMSNTRVVLANEKNMTKRTFEGIRETEAS